MSEKSMKFTLGDLVACSFIIGLTTQALLDVGQPMLCGSGPYAWARPICFFAMAAMPYLLYRFIPDKERGSTS